MRRIIQYITMSLSVYFYDRMSMWDVIRVTLGCGVTSAGG